MYKERRNGALMKEERRQQIMQLIKEKGKATVPELSELFGVSESTIRRDLEELDMQGVVRRAYGGAISVERAPPEPPVIHRMAENEEEKRRIGQAAAELIQDGDTIFFGSGTTTLEVARNLGNKKDLTVITNALTIANLLAEQTDITLVIVGGLLRHSELSLIGHIAVQTLKELHVDKVIMGARAIDAQCGLTNDYLPETLTEIAITGLASEVIVVADHSKFGKVSTALVAPVLSVSRIITDTGVPAEIIDEFNRLGVEVVIV
jgi:DeoR/GlpR family transcriptional regulator of sugar metabolism